MDKQQKLVMQLQLYERSLKVLAERQNVLMERMQEIYETLRSIDELEKGDSLISIGSGNFVYGKITDVSKILVGMGAGVAIEKTPEEAKNILKKRISELEKTLTDVSREMQHVSAEMQKIERKIQMQTRKK